jgi:Integrase core domain
MLVPSGCHTSFDYTQTLNDHGVLASIGTVGDAYDNALAESFVDSFKTELIADRVWATRSQLELAVVEYVAWFNDERLHEALADKTPREREEEEYARERKRNTLNNKRQPRAVAESWKATETVSAEPRTAHLRPTKFYELRDNLGKRRCTCATTDTNYRASASAASPTMRYSKRRRSAGVPYKLLVSARTYRFAVLVISSATLATRSSVGICRFAMLGA